MKNKTKLILGFISFCLILSLTLTLLLTKSNLNFHPQVSLMSISSNTSTRLKNSYKYFSGTETKTISLKEGETLNINYSSTVKKGSLKISVLNSKGDTLKTLPSNTNSTETINSEKADKLKIKVEGTKTSGNYDITWSSSQKWFYKNKI